MNETGNAQEQVPTTCPLCGAPIEKHPGRKACDRYPTTETPQR